MKMLKHYNKAPLYVTASIQQDVAAAPRFHRCAASLGLGISSQFCQSRSYQ